jgi:hypothetical protein
MTATDPSLTAIALTIGRLARSGGWIESSRTYVRTGMRPVRHSRLPI